MVSERCTQYLATLERVPQTLDRQGIERAIISASAPVFDSVVEFQIEFGGYVQMYGLNRFEWGLIHTNPDKYSEFRPNQVDYQPDGDEHFFTCCNCHGSDHWELDSSGALYWSGPPPVASSFVYKLERDAVHWDLTNNSPTFQQIKLDCPADEVRPLLRERLLPGLIREASDVFESLFWHQDVYASITEHNLIVALTDTTDSEILQGIPYHIPKPLPEVQKPPPSPREALNEMLNRIKRGWR